MMKALQVSPRRPFAPLVVLALNLVALLTLTEPGFAQTPADCGVTVTPAVVHPNEPFSLCAPTGAGYTYSWYDQDFNLVGTDACYSSASGLPAGTYAFSLLLGQDTNMNFCQFSLVVVDQPLPVPCDITIDPAGDVCAGQSFTLCGPVAAGVTYQWRDAQSRTMTGDRCVTVAGLPAGTYSFDLDVTRVDQTASCTAQVVVRACSALAPNCPRGPGFWSQPCAHPDRPHVPFDATQMTAITGGVDNLSSFFDWGGSTLSSFCGTVDPPRPMNPRKQAKRQYVTLLANVAAGELGVGTHDGRSIMLAPSTPIQAGGMTATTVAELITEVDGLLGQLEGQSLSDPGVRSTYQSIQDACEAINEGLGIGAVCGGDSKSEFDSAGLEANDSAIELDRPSPNPFSGMTRVAYAVPDAGGTVEIGVYDVAGRLVKLLASGFQPAGRYQVRWDGTDASGRRLTSGVFFLRGTIGGQVVSGRLMLLR